ncbi:hypothetical protein [Dactylococcopsis salina]|uniref:Uncharacterized protein n=1 Tax=Dactylococcopsis salina (strain PCC 8305) TaxID=13035 RepID=K9YSK8_DACS8|nr:hypothetical protein [Dactylococcopsis salina]AFZ49098.1 hypothetical protein Dacsa_0294 [Dactylococcopsis salina PCC 8305]
MKTSSPWQNFLALLPGTLLTLLTITVAFLRFYDEQDFTILGQIREPRLWSNRLTVAALLVAVVNFSVEWNRRNRETNRLAEDDQRRGDEERRRREEATRTENERVERRQGEIQRDRAAAEERERANRERNRAAEERERAARRTRIQNRGTILQIRYQVEPNEANGQALRNFLAFLEEYGE